MRVMSLPARVRAAFDAETASAFGEQFITIILDNWRDAGRSLRRAVILTVTLVISFILLHGAKSLSSPSGPSD
jgi:hypothetical protein